MIGYLRIKNPLFFILFLISPVYLSGQSKPAKFSFNNRRDYDEVSGRKAKLPTVTPTKDRFGNDNNAVYIYGSKYSYVNFGNYEALKPKRGTISFWAIIYAIYYFLEFEKLDCATGVDSTCQFCLLNRDTIKRSTWHHVAISYDDTSFALYLNGVLENRIRKNFITKFLAGDSVIVGNTANEKNSRYLLGSVDDIEFYDHILTDEEIKDLILLFLIYLYTRYRIRTVVRREKEKSEQANAALENELRVHRAMMNPHFIFNSLNGLQDFILKNANQEANDYLIKFSQLLRKIMESNMSNSISLELELELLKNYIEIEGMRFEENITYTITIDPAIASSVTIIPIMMLQPFVENAIWHGLLTKEGDKRISITFELCQVKYLKCVIEDNGLGRKDNRPIKKKSMAIVFIKQRIELLNAIHKVNCSLAIEDKPNGQGTIVTIILPILNG